MAAKGILGRKLGMTQLWDANNRIVPVTVIAAGPCHVVQLKTPERDGYSAVQLSFGEVKGYKENGKDVPAFTNMGGAFKHADKHKNVDPFALPDSWNKHKGDIKLDTAFNFVSTADIIGGNSGSPTVNKEGEVVGIIFDGNIQSLPWNFAYSDVQGRAVSVDSRGIKEALRKVYGATALADELTGTKTAGAKAGK